MLPDASVAIVSGFVSKQLFAQDTHAPETGAAGYRERGLPGDVVRGVRLRDVHPDVDVWDQIAPNLALELVPVLVRVETGENDVAFLEGFGDAAPVILVCLDVGVGPHTVNQAFGDIDLCGAGLDVGRCAADQPIEVAVLDDLRIDDDVVADADVCQLLADM